MAAGWTAVCIGVNIWYPLSATDSVARYLGRRERAAACDCEGRSGT